MKKLYLLFILFFIFSLSSSFAQLHNYGFKLGLQGHYVIPANEFTDDQGVLARAFLRFELSKLFDLEGGVGYGVMDGLDYGGNDYVTEWIPIDIRILLSPFEWKSVNPYLGVGIGGMQYWIDDSPKFPQRPTDDQLSSFLGMAVTPVIGTEIALSSNWILDISGTFNIADGDAMNGLVSNLNDDFLHEYDRYYSIGLGVAYVSEGCDADHDGDGIGRCDEELLGTDPNNPDTDGDGLWDGEEVNIYKTDPLNKDSDGDGLTDYEEVKNYKTDPNKADTDGDGLNDYDELMKHKTDPLNKDTDGDNLTDGDEVLKHKTDPTKKDTDGDGLQDGAEVSIHKTDPTNKDSDGDKLTDGEEVNKYKTDPNDRDTDDGSIDDGTEVARGTDPLDPSDDVPAVPDQEFDHILFDFDKYNIKKSEVPKLEAAFKFFVKHEDVLVDVSGYTDSIGTYDYNKKLSVKRGNEVKKWLVDKGISADRISVEGYAEANPVAPNTTKEGRKQNRRVVIRVTDMHEN